MKRAKQFRCQLTVYGEDNSIVRQSEHIYVQAPDRDTAVYWLHVNAVPDFGWEDGEELSITAVQIPDEVAMAALGPEIAPPLPLQMPTPETSEIKS